jgi:hypothetical protein
MDSGEHTLQRSTGVRRYVTCRHLSCRAELTLWQDYNITHYCAELVNTLTNVMFLYLGYVGIRNCLRYSEPPIFILAYLGYTVVGIGSMAFHATLKCRCCIPYARTGSGAISLIICSQTRCS